MRVVIHSLAHLAVGQDGGVANRIFHRPQFLDSVAGLQVTVARMHGHHAMLDLFEHVERILARQNGIGGVVLHAEPRRVDLVHDLEKNILLLGEFRVGPEIVLVVVFHAEHDALAGTVFQHFLDALHHPLHALLARDAGAALAGKHAAEAAAELGDDVHVALLVFHFLAPILRTRLGEVRRAAQHGHFHFVARVGLADLLQVGIIKAGQGSIIKFQAFDRQVRGHINPLK